MRDGTKKMVGDNTDHRQKLEITRSIVNDAMKNRELIIINEFSIMDSNKILSLVAEIKQFYQTIYGIDKKYENLNTFGIALEKAMKNIGFGNVLLVDGFSDVETSLINAFLKADPRIQWGGTFNSKIDGMHFGFKTSSVRDIIK